MNDDEEEEEDEPQPPGRLLMALRAAVHLKTLGNERFGKKDYYDAIALYGRALGFLADRPDENQNDDDQHKRERTSLKATLWSNRAQALLRLSNFGLAARDCTEALTLDPHHAKSRHRLNVAGGLRKAYHEALAKFQELRHEHDALCDPEHHHQNNDEGRLYPGGYELTQSMVELARTGLDPYWHAMALLRHAEICLLVAHDHNERERLLLVEARASTNEALALCQNFGHRHLEVCLHEHYRGDGDEQDRKRGHLLFQESKAWLLLARCIRQQQGQTTSTANTEAGGNGASPPHDDKSPAERALAHLQKALERNKAAEPHLEKAGDPCHGLLNLRVGICHDLAEVAAECGRWGEASGACRAVAAIALSANDPRWTRTAAGAASYLCAGGAPTRPLMCGTLTRIATHQRSQGDLPGCAATYRQLLNARHTSWGIDAHHQQHGPETTRSSSSNSPPTNSEEAGQDAGDLREFLSLMKQMGRAADDTCSICLEPLLRTHEHEHDEHPIVDVMECFHVFHSGCIREALSKHARSWQREAGGHWIAVGDCPNCRTEIRMEMAVRATG